MTAASELSDAHTSESLAPNSSHRRSQVREPSFEGQVPAVFKDTGVRDNGAVLRGAGL